MNKTSSILFDSNWETVFGIWAQPPSDTEKTICDNTINAVSEAINGSSVFNDKNIKVFAQGSYRNQVNIKQDSDVDIGIVCFDAYFHKGENYSISDPPSPYTFDTYKNDLEDALRRYFKTGTITRGNKAFKIRGTSNRIQADVVPFFELRVFSENRELRRGVRLLPDNGGQIDNYPERLRHDWPNIPLHYENGVNKDIATNYRYKSTVRIIKNIRRMMEDEGYVSARDIPSYLIECLVWNVPNSDFYRSTWVSTVLNVLTKICLCTLAESGCKLWTEVDAIKPLFTPDQPWTREQAYTFAKAAWDCFSVS